MQYKKFTNVQDFYNATYDILMRDEAQNLVPLGNLLIGYEGTDKTDWRDPANWCMAIVSDESSVRLTAIMTPPHNVTLYATDNKISAAAIDCMINGMADEPIPGVLAEKSLANAFAEAYTARHGKAYETTMDHGIYELTEVNPKVPQIGTIRLVEEKDMPFLPFWLEAFYPSAHGDSRMPLPISDENSRYRISKKNLYVLEVDGVPVSLAGLNREMQTVVGVGPVFTPLYFQGRGYASSCVAQLSQLALEKGFSKCVLYTDLANPTSNSIYKKIGYRQICDSLMLKFV